MVKTFQYVAIDKAGAKQSGTLEASSRGDVIRELQRMGVRATSITEVAAGKAKKAKNASNVIGDDELIPLKNKDVICFTEELSELLEAGLPLEPALASMEARDESGLIKLASGRLRKWVTEGVSMYQALPKVSSQFDQLYCNLVKAGEASGSLQTILLQHGNYLKAQMELRSRLMQAMIYPAFLIFACMLVTLVFIFYLLPKITLLLEGMPGSQMPVGVKIAKAIGDGLRNHWIVIIVVLIGIMVSVKVWADSETNKALWDKWKIKLPLYGSVISFGFYVQWLQTLGNLVANGVPLVQALELTNQTVTNRYYHGRLKEITAQVGDGYKLTRCMRNSDIFTPNMVDLIGVGENTGKLSRALIRAADYYDKRLNVMLRSLLGIISPLILVSMALLVALLSYTMIQAIYETISHLRK